LDRGEQMSVDISDPAPKQRTTLDELNDLRICRDTGMWQVRERLQHDFALTQVAQSKFADDEGVRQNHPSVQQRDECFVARPEMVDPDGCIGQDQGALDRRRGGAFKPGWLPPKRANLRALSRSMRALSASRTKLDFSFKPVKASAFATSSSSKAMVVRICRSPSRGTNLSSNDVIFNAGIP
jgi:hypothetical protein